MSEQVKEQVKGVRDRFWQVKGVRDRFWEIGNCPSIIDDVACILSKRRFLLRLTVRETGGKLLQFGGNYFTGGIDGSST